MTKPATAWLNDVAPAVVNTPAVEELKTLPKQWVCWRYEERKGKPTKPPMKPFDDGGSDYASSTDPTTWGDYEQAIAYQDQRSYDGVGFVLDNGYAGLDLDDCRDPQTGEIEPEARAIIDRLDSYTEVSPSLKGGKIFIKTDKPLPQGLNKEMGAWGVEMYSQERYFTVTGRHLPGTPDTINERTDELLALYEELNGGAATETPGVVFSENGSGERPDLDQFDLSAANTAIIRHGHPPDCDRSQVDQSIISALIVTGASDDQIKAVYDHYPIGTKGKYAEKGRNGEKYLAHSIAKARGYLDENGSGQEADEDKGRRGTKDALTSEYRAVLRRLLDSPPQMNAMDDSVSINDELLTDGLAAKIDNLMRDEGFTNSQRIRNVYIGWAYENQFHPVRDYLDGLTWDGGDHLAWLMQYMTFGPAYQTDDPDRPWAYWYIKRWMIGAVAKAYEATQNFSLVLDGPQGIGKSYLVRWLCPPALRDYFSEAHYQAGNKDSRLEQMRTWIWELPELQAVTRKSDREELKHGISRLWITERPPYGRYPIRKPNLTSFVGTINESGAGFLNDPTGHRRFVVVKLESIDWDYDDVVDVDQLWAQAVAAYKQGDPWQLTAEEQTKQRLINEGYETSSPLAEMFYTHYRIDHNIKLWKPAMAIIRDLEEMGLKGNQWVMLQELAELMQKEGVSKGRPRLDVDGQQKQVTAYKGVVQR